MQILVKGMFARVLFASLLTVVFSVVAAAQSAAEVDAVVQKMIDAKGIPAAGLVVVLERKAHALVTLEAWPGGCHQLEPFRASVCIGERAR